MRNMTPHKVSHQYLQTLIARLCRQLPNSAEHFRTLSNISELSRAFPNMDEENFRTLPKSRPQQTHRDMIAGSPVRLDLDNFAGKNFASFFEQITQYNGPSF